MSLQVSDGNSQPQLSMSADWVQQRLPNGIRYMILKAYQMTDPMVIKSVTFYHDGSWLFRAYGITKQLNYPFPDRIVDQEIMSKLLEHAKNIHLCCGNPDDRYTSLVHRRGGLLSNATVVSQVVEDGNQTYMKTIRHNRCSIILPSTSRSARCQYCIEHGNSLRKLLSRSKDVDCSRTRVDSKTRLSILNPDELLVRARELTKSLKATRLQAARLMEKQLKATVEAEGVDVGDVGVSEGLQQAMVDNASAIFTKYPPDSFGRLFWEQQAKAHKTSDPRGYRWHPMMIKWCLNLYLSSAKGYDNVRASGVLKLPNKSTLASYIHWTPATSGFTTDSLKQLCRELKLPERQEHQKYVIIVHDEMKVKSDLVYKKSTGQLVGFTQLGSFEDQLRTFEDSVQSETEATKGIAHHVLVFQVRALFWHFSYPLAHFPTTNTKGTEIFSLFWKAVEVLELAGLKVVGVTCDGASTNRKFMDMHGPTTPTNPIFKATSPYSEDYAREIFLFNDPPHLIKCARNAWENKKRMLWVGLCRDWFMFLYAI